MKTLFLSIILLTTSLNNIFAQETKGNYTENINSLIDEVNSLPKTLESGFPEYRKQVKYTLKKRGKVDLVLYDDCYKPKSTTRTVESYVTRIKITDLHPDGVHLWYNNDSSTISLMLFTANNTNSIKQKGYVNHSLSLRNYQDRVAIGSWKTDIVYDQLNRISELLKVCIADKTSWTETDRPHTKPISAIYTSKNKSHPIDTTREHTLMNISLKRPALFENAKTAKENNTYVSKYVVDKLIEKDIRLKKDAYVEITINQKGEVVKADVLNTIESHYKKAIEEIILSMPNWKSGTYNESNLNISQNIIIKK